MDIAAFEKDRKTYDGVERCFERITEAAAKLGEMAQQLMPDQPWQKVRALGNVLRHEYDTIREDRLFRDCSKPIFRVCARRLKKRCAGWIHSRNHEKPEALSIYSRW